MPSPAPSSGRTALSQWTYWAGSLARVEAPGAFDLARMTGSLTALAAAESAAYVGDDRGTIVALPLYGNPGELSRSNLAQPTAVTAWGDRAALAAAGEVWLFEITAAPRLFGTRTSVRDYAVERIVLPDHQEPAAAFVDERTLAVWDRRGRGLRVYSLPPPGGGIGAVELRSADATLFGAPLLEVSAAGSDALLTLEADGTIQMIDRATLQRLYRYVSPGTRAVAWLSDTCSWARARACRGWSTP